MTMRAAGRSLPLRLVGLAVCASLLGGCTSTVAGSGSAVPRTSGSSGSPGAAPEAGVRASFVDCSNVFDLSAAGVSPQRAAHLTISCARLPVPLSYTHASTGSIDLELVRVHDSRNRGSRPLVVNPGGPGASGIAAAVGLAAQVPDELLAGYDIVGFDPRGVGVSHPVRCLSDQEKDRLSADSPDVLTPSGFASAKADAQTVAQACGSKYGASLADYNTVETARDMDRIRIGLGAARLDYLGFSYGTELGGVYAHLFPTKVGAFVLDGAVDPLPDDITAFATQIKGFEDAFDQFAADCRTHASCASIGDPRQAVEELVQKADAQPIPTSAPNDRRRATSSLVLTGVLSALYSKAQWPQLGQAIKAAQGGDAKGLLELADQYLERGSDGTYTNIADANTAISCNDSRPGPSDATIRATAQKWARAYPMFGLWSAASLFGCQVWQPARTPVPKPTAPSTPGPILVVGNLHDPATPYVGAQHLTATLGHARLLTWDGEGHTSYLSGSNCVDAAVDAYLLHGTLPAAGKVCPR